MTASKLRLSLAIAGLWGVCAVGGADEERQPRDLPSGSERPVTPSTSSHPSPPASHGEEERRLEELEARGLKIEATRGKDWSFPQAIHTICLDQAGLGPKGRHMAQARAARVLEKTEDLPLDIHWVLANVAGYAVDAEGRPLGAEARAELRKKTAIRFLEWWQRLEKSIDKSWTLVSGPGRPEGWQAGLRPEAIADPKLRAEYEAALKAHREKQERDETQSRLRDLKEHRIPVTKRILVHLYMDEPERLKEFEELLDKYAVDLMDAQERAELVQGAKDKKMPNKLVRRSKAQSDTAPAAPTSRPE